MNDLEKEFYYRRVSAWRGAYGHAIRYLFYKKLSEHYENKREKKFLKK